MLQIHYSNENRMGGILSNMYRTILDFEGEVAIGRFSFSVSFFNSSRESLADWMGLVERKEGG